MSSPEVRRCAVYTRKSSEEGLEQDFNSLHAQREACDAYIRSQRHEGWRLIETAYDDGGISGATMERPGLQRLLEDIQADRIDTVVVYKVDRLTRSLADFAKMVELFDAHGVSFVAVTQQFNTTTSMGRLTLNVLLSFAQFEREVTGERIRDKIAASKKKGMWMGGFVPLGYDLKDRKLLINSGEAEIVRRIFRRYVALGSVRRLKEDLDRDRVLSKTRTGKMAERCGGRPFSRGALYQLLSNPLYVGEIRHKGVNNPGQHRAIIDPDLWAQAQHQLKDGGSGPRPRTAKVEASPLAGRLFDEFGERLTPSHAVKNGRRYRYYISRRLVTGTGDPQRPGWRLPAREIERAVAAAASEILKDRPALVTAMREADVLPTAIEPALVTADRTARKLLSETDLSSTLGLLVDRVELQADAITVSLSLQALLPHGLTNSPRPVITRRVPMLACRRGQEARLIVGNDVTRPSKPDMALLKVIARATGWLADLVEGRSLADLARRDGVTDRYVGRILPLALLAPEVVELICEGRQPLTVTANRLIARARHLPLEWKQQSAPWQ
jgi:site-specific DNA recombinase